MPQLISRINACLRGAFKWYAISSTEKNTRNERQAIYIFAVVALAANATILGAALFYFFYDAQATWLGNLVCILFSVSLSLPIIARRNRFIAEILASFLVCIFGTALSYIYGADAGFNMHLLIGVLFLTLECSTKRIGKLVLVTAPPFALFVLIPVLFPHPVTYLPISTELVDSMFRGNVALVICMTLFTFILIMRRTEQAEDALELEHKRSELLLENLLPAEIAKRLKQSPNKIIADEHPSVTILFADIVNFTPRASAMEPKALVALLNTIFSEFDKLAALHSLEKIKTIGDAYMVAGGLEQANPCHLKSVANMALDMMEAVARISGGAKEPIEIRIGLHSGKAVAGVIGTKKIFYDVWGETVNIASRLEGQGQAARILVTASTQSLLQDDYLFERRGVTEIKGLNPTELFWLVGKRE